MGRSGKGIEAEGLVRRFKDVEAVAGIDLSIRPGEALNPLTFRSAFLAAALLFLVFAVWARSGLANAERAGG